MEIEKFCFECGKRLRVYDKQVECTGCGAVYSDMLISESFVEDDMFKITELSVCMDITIKTIKEPVTVETMPEDMPAFNVIGLTMAKEAVE